MTINQLMESVLGKSCCLEGEFGDATPFTSSSVGVAKQLCDRLGMNDFEKTGTEPLYNGLTGEYMGDVFIGPVYYQRLKHLVAEKIHCLTGEHDVLTKSGWKNITKITMNDMVATLENNKLVYTNPIKILEYPDHEGDMYYISNDNVDLLVTENHRMWVSSPRIKHGKWSKYTFEKANNIFGKHVRYKKDAEWKCKKFQLILPSVLNFPEKKIDMNSWLIFFGMIIFNFRIISKNKIHITITKERVKEYLFETIKLIGYKFSVIDDKTISISDYQLCHYMSSNKKLPSWILELNKRQSRLLVQSLLFTNGKSKNRSFEYDTFSTEFADQLQHLCLHAGWSANISLVIPKGYKKFINNREFIYQHDLLKVTVITRKYYHTANHPKEKNEIEKLFYQKCPVYCLEVPSEVFYVRLNGKAVWTGNSRAQGPNATLTRQPLEGRSREGGKLMPQWYLKLLLVYIVVGNIIKNRGTLKCNIYRNFQS